ncbi:PD40 domain-containing protein, partial [bacterium]|nr:PD40 domain-containing protein [bacterium]
MKRQTWGEWFLGRVRERAARRNPRRLQLEALESRLVPTVQVLTPAATAGTAADHSLADGPVVSADGRYVVFETAATDLVGGVTDTNGTTDVFLRDRVLNTTTLVSARGSVAGNAESRDATVSADGRYVVFRSQATDLVTGQIDTAGTWDAFLYDIGSGSIKLVSRAAGTTTTAAGGVGAVTASGSGGAVVFTSDALNLVAGQTDTNGGADVFRFDTATEAVRLVSGAGESTTATGDGFSDAPTVSDDGRFIAYRSAASNLAPGQDDETGFTDVFLFDAQDGTTTLVSHVFGSPGVTGFGAAEAPVLSADGSTLVFVGYGTALVENQNDFNGSQDLFLYDVATGAVTLVSHTAGDPTMTGDGYSEGAALSADGRYVAYRSSSSDLVTGQADSNFMEDVFLYDRDSNASVLVSHIPGDGTTAVNLFSQTPTITADGSRVAFVSLASDIVSVTDTNDALDVFVYDRDSGDVTPVSVTPGGLAASDGQSERATISRDGSTIVFQASSSDLDPADADGFVDVYAWGTTAANTAPAASLDSVSLVRVEGTSITVTGSGSDAEDPPASLGLSWEVFKDGGVTPFATGTGASYSFTPADNGSYRIVLTVTDSGGLSNSAEQTITVSNAAPSPSIVSVGGVRVEGTSIAVTGSATDPAGASDTLSYAWQVFKDGAVTPLATGAGADYSFTPDDDGSYRIVLTASDEDGGSASAEQTITVSNVAPTPSITSIGSVRVEGMSIAVSGSATDPAGVNDTLTYSWAVYKDGSPTPFATGSGTSYSFYSFTPDDDGSYRIVLTVSDEDGGSASAEQTISVNNAAPTPSIVSVGAVRVEGTSVAVSG